LTKLSLIISENTLLVARLTKSSVLKPSLFPMVTLGGVARIWYEVRHESNRAWWSKKKEWKREGIRDGKRRGENA